MPSGRKFIKDVAFGGRDPLSAHNITVFPTDPTGTLNGMAGNLCIDSSGATVYICTASGNGWVIITN